MALFALLGQWIKDLQNDERSTESMPASRLVSNQVLLLLLDS